MKKTILVIEDDRAVCNLITTSLTVFGYKCHFAANGGSAMMEAVTLQPDMFILDLGLPDMDGTEIITKLRTWTNRPIIVVSARNETQDIITALDAGADDYLTKPFSVEELMARIRASFRKTGYEDGGAKDSNILTNGDLRIDYAANCVYLNETEIHLTPIEYKLLTLLSRNMGKVLTHNHILKEIWGGDYEYGAQSLRAYMTSLRKKIEKKPSEPVYLQTHIGVGYRMASLK